MVGREWVNTVAEKIAVLESQPPGEDKAVTLAALYVLQARFREDAKPPPPVAVNKDKPPSGKTLKEPTVSKSGFSVSANPWILNVIEDELDDAEKYYKWWMQDGDFTIKEIAWDELKHADRLIKMARATAPPKYDARLKQLSARYREVAGWLS